VTDNLQPMMMAPRALANGWTALPAWLPVPEMGGLPVNCFVLDGPEPVLVDTGLAPLGDAFLRHLSAAIDPARLRWIWLSHMDFDHIGNLQAVLAAAPNAVIVTNFLGMGKMQLAGMAVDRVHLLAPGARLRVGGQDFVPLRPPYYDAPETMGFVTTGDGALFVGDCLGALLPKPVVDLAEIGDRDLAEGLSVWSSIDAPWIAGWEEGSLDGAFSALAGLGANTLLTSHLPPAGENASSLITRLSRTARFGQGVGDDPLTVGAVAAALNHEATLVA